MSDADRAALKHLLSRIPDVNAQASLLATLGDAPVSNDVPAEVLRVLWGQEASEVLMFGHEPMALAEMFACKMSMDNLLASGHFDDLSGDMAQEAEPDSVYDQPWWSSDWWPFLSDGAGQLICWDKANNSIIEFLHDDPTRDILFDNDPFAFLIDMAERVAQGRSEWRKDTGFMTGEQLARLDAFVQQQEQREQQRQADVVRVRNQLWKVGAAVVGLVVFWAAWSWAA